MSGNPLNSRQKGKIAEFYVISNLIANGIDVYVPVLDMGVDSVARSIAQEIEKSAERAR